MDPAQVLRIQSTAVLHLKYMQYYLFHEKNPRASNKQSSNNNEQDSAFPPMPLVLQYYTPPSVSMSTLCDPIELLRASDTLPSNFWSFNRHFIPSRPRMAPPPVRTIQREHSGIERTILLARKFKQRFIEQYQDDGPATIKLVMGKVVQRKAAVMRKRKDIQKTVRKDHAPKRSSPLRNSSANSDEKEAVPVDRRDSKMDEMEESKPPAPQIKYLKKNSFSRSVTNLLPKTSNASFKQSFDELHKIADSQTLWKTLTSTFSKLLNL
jgi:hypothetical protein